MTSKLAAFGLLATLLGAEEQPKPSLPDLSGNSQTLDQYRGRIVVLNFWATWCIPCREEVPLLVDNCWSS